MKQSIFLTLPFLALALGCAKANPPSSQNLTANEVGIIGGQTVSSSDAIASTTVAIYDTRSKALCTGSILSSQLILTAGHCAIDSTPSSLRVLFGTSMVSKPLPVARQVTAFQVHPDYIRLTKNLEANPKLSFDDAKNQGDLAVIRFEGGLPQGYRPVEILKDASEIANQASVILAGYGLSNGDTHQGAGVLREVSIAIEDAHFSPTEVLLDQEKGEGACHGDSGGPAFLKIGPTLYLFGVTSRGYHDPQNDCLKHSVYTNVLAQSAFVKRAMQELQK